uniref:Kinesin motor domain-containing protein n=1 Tax=Odontella aurita TaxID=265563 RepID=A0A7S4JSM0_9STRA|mmetsp:Transcript_53203/g.159260  ORF Transcript_53203/g.159260 Transcript_53203/m.159260 type:complete len:959 (+) Transcript_53203:98-2974(+)
MIDQKLLKERRNRRLNQSAADSSRSSSADSSSSTSSTPTSTAPAASGKISMTWAELEESISTTAETPHKKNLKKTDWATPESSIANRRGDRPPLSASAKKSKSARSIASDTAASMALDHSGSRFKSKQSLKKSFVSSAPNTPGVESFSGRKSEDRQKIKIIMTSDDLSKSIASAHASDGRTKARSLDREALRARRAKMLQERSRQSLAGSRHSSRSTLQEDDAISTSDSSLKSRIQSGILRGGTPPAPLDCTSRLDSLPSDDTGQSLDMDTIVVREDQKTREEMEIATPAAKNRVRDLEGESGMEGVSPSSRRDAAAKLMLERARARKARAMKGESPRLDQTQSSQVQSRTDSKAPKQVTPVTVPEVNSQKQQVKPELPPQEIPENCEKLRAMKEPEDVALVSSKDEEPKTTTSSTPTTRTPLKQLPLSVKRERSQRKENRRSRQRSPSRSETRCNLDKRTARMRYSRDFRTEIEKNRRQQPPTHTDDLGDCGKQVDPYQREHNGISVFVRKRPLFDYEVVRNDYDVVDMGGQVEGNDGYDTVTIHNCTMHPDMRRKFVQQVTFPCSASFDDTCSNDDIFNSIADPLVNLAANGNVATILMYGQTGSGKTHTMTGIEERTADKLFSELTDAVDSDAPRTRSGPGGLPTVVVQFVELCGKSCKDLLGRGDEVKLAEEKDGSVRLVNATAMEAESSADLARLIAKGKCRRATEATDANGVSSRSHAVCQIGIKFPNRRRRGLLTLIDCAGSERNKDSMYHSSQRQKESAEINASLWSLKECIRARNNGEVVPYRSSLLTRILRESFEREGAKLSVIATVAPNASDTEHSCETLKTVSTIVGCDSMISEGEKNEVVSQEKKKSDIVPPRAWDHSQLVAFLSRKKIDLKISENIDGKTVMRMNVQQIRARLCRGNGDDKLPTKVFNELRKENDRVDKIQRKDKLALKKKMKQDEWENSAVYR